MRPAVNVCLTIQLRIELGNSSVRLHGRQELSTYGGAEEVSDGKVLYHQYNRSIV